VTVDSFVPTAVLVSPVIAVLISPRICRVTNGSLGILPVAFDSSVLMAVLFGQPVVPSGLFHHWPQASEVFELVTW